MPPSREDKVNPNEHVSGKQHAKNKPEGEDEFPEGLRFGGDGGGKDGGGAILSNLGPLLVMICAVVAGSVTRGELVALDTGLLLGLRLITTLDLALVEAALDTESEGIWYLYWDDACISHGRLALMGGMALTDWAIRTTLTIPISPSVASATSGGSPKTA